MEHQAYGGWECQALGNAVEEDVREGKCLEGGNVVLANRNTGLGERELRVLDKVALDGGLVCSVGDGGEEGVRLDDGEGNLGGDGCGGV